MGLHYAAAMGNVQILKRYIQAIRRQRRKIEDLFGWNAAGLKADDFLNLRNNDQQTPRNLALNTGHSACVKIIDDEQRKGLRELGNGLRMTNHLRRLSPIGLRQPSANINRHASFDNLLYVDRDGQDDAENLLSKSDVSNFGRSIQMLKGNQIHLFELFFDFGNTRNSLIGKLH